MEIGMGGSRDGCWTLDPVQWIFLQAELKWEKALYGEGLPVTLADEIDSRRSILFPGLPEVDRKTK